MAQYRKKFPHNWRNQKYYLVEDPSPEELAKLTRLHTEDFVAMRHAIDHANGKEARDKAWKNYTLAVTVTLPEVGLILGRGPNSLKSDVTSGNLPGIYYLGRYRMWIDHLETIKQIFSN